MGVTKHEKMLAFVLGGACVLRVAAWATESRAEPLQPHRPSVPIPAGRAADVKATAPWVPRVVVSIQPLAGLVRPLVEALGGVAADRGLDVDVLIPAGVSEHGYEPTPPQMARVSGADLVVLVGLGLDANLERFVADPLAVGGGPPGTRAGAAGKAGGRALVVFADVMTAEAVQRGAAEAPADHPAHATDECEHHDGDPHMWLDPMAAKRLVERVRAVLAERLDAIGGADVADRRGALDAAAARVAGELDALDVEYTRALAGHRGRTVVVAHDAYGWLARRYELKFVAIAGLNAGEPTPGELAKASAAVRGLGLTSVYVEPQMSRAAAERVAAATGAKVRVLDPLGTGDYFAMMRGNLRALVEGW